MVNPMQVQLLSSAPSVNSTFFAIKKVHCSFFMHWNGSDKSLLKFSFSTRFGFLKTVSSAGDIYCKILYSIYLHRTMS